MLTIQLSEQAAVELYNAIAGSSRLPPRPSTPAFVVVEPTPEDSLNPTAYWYRALLALGITGERGMGLAARAGAQANGHYDAASLKAAIQFVVANEAAGDAMIAKSTADQLERDRLANIDRARPDWASGPFPAASCLPLADANGINPHANFLHAVSGYYSGHTGGRGVYMDALHGDGNTVSQVVAIEAGAVDWALKAAYNASNGPLVSIVDGLIAAHQVG